MKAPIDALADRFAAAVEFRGPEGPFTTWSVTLRIDRYSIGWGSGNVPEEAVEDLLSRIYDVESADRCALCCGPGVACTTAPFAVYEHFRPWGRRVLSRKTCLCTVCSNQLVPLVGEDD